MNYFDEKISMMKCRLCLFPDRARCRSAFIRYLNSCGDNFRFTLSTPALNYPIFG